MKGRRLCALSALALVVACQDQKVPTALSGRSAPGNPSAMISDGAHGGNPDFFFLPPMVSNPANIPPPTNYEPGKFNATLAPSLSVDICQLQDAPVDAQGLPVAATQCVAGPAKKSFPAGTVRLQAGTPDGFYQVIWHTQESSLDVSKYYRIKVNVLGSSMSFGAADIDPVANMKEFRNVRTGEVIPLNDDSTLPINFRIENAGGPTLCDGVALCTSVVVTNDIQQVVQVQGNNGPIAGGVFPAGWLPPPPGPQSVIVTIKNFNTGANDVFAGTQATPCHAGLPDEQFNACFTFTTTPHLAGLAPGGHQFMREVTVVTCFVLDKIPLDPREPWVQQWSSGLSEPPHPLKSVSDALVLMAPTEHNCGSNFPTEQNGSNTTGSNALTQLASNGWRALKGAVGGFFGIKTAYAVDLGLGGSTLDFSNIGPALTAEIRPYTSTAVTVTAGSSTTVTARIVGTQVHNGDPLGEVTFTGNTHGIPGLPVTFTLAPENGTFIPFGSEGDGVTQATVITSPLLDVSISGGFASVSWTPPSTPGTYRITANGPAIGGPVTFTATVTSALPNPILSFTGTEFYSVNNVNFVRYNLAVTNYQAYPAAMFVAAPDLPPCGLNTSASRTWINIYDASNDSYIYGFCGFGSPSDMQGMWFAEPVGTAPPDQVYIKMIDRATNTTYMSNSVHPIPPQ